MADYREQKLAYLLKALQSGHNVLLAGLFQPCWDLACQLFKYDRVTIIPPMGKLPQLPLRWQIVSGYQDIPAIDSQLIIDFSGRADLQAVALLQRCGTLVWIPAASVSQALMRFEIACGRDDSPLLVPAILNMVALAAPGTKNAFISELDNIVVAEPAYKPIEINFGQTVNQNCSELTASELPTVLNLPPFDEEAAYQEERDLQDLAAAAQEAGYDFPETDTDEEPEEDDDDYSAYTEDDSENMAQNFDPGWELEMLMANGKVTPSDDVSAAPADSGDLAATYRLGPPPKPLSLIDAERATKPGNIVLPPPAVTPSTQAVNDSFERKFGPPPGSTPTVSQNNMAPRSFQQVFAQRQKRH